MTYECKVSAKILSWPGQCACCGEAAESHVRAAASRTTGTRVKKTTTSSWDVPYCVACLGHASEYKSADTWLTVGAIVGLLTAILIGLTSSNVPIGLLLGLAFFAGCTYLYRRAQGSAKSLMKSACCTPAFAVQYSGWYGTVHTFHFESRSYAEQFISANAKKVLG
jgi:hypothetical protein